MSYAYPDLTEVDFSWVGDAAYSHPDPAAVDISWSEAPVGVSGTVAAGMRYVADIRGVHSVPVAGRLVAAMRYAGDIRGVHAPPVVGTVVATMRYAAQVAGQHAGPPQIIISDDTEARYIYIAEISYARDWEGYPVETLRITSEPGGLTLGAADTPAGAYVRGGLLDPGWMRREMASGASMLGATRASYGAAVIANPDGSLDYLDDCGVDGRHYTLYIGEPGDVFPGGYDVLFRAVMVNKLVDRDRVEIHFRGFEELLDVPICSERFAGTGELEGGADLVNKPKPRYYDVNKATRSAPGTYNILHPYVMEPIEQRPPPAIPVVLLDEGLQLYYVCANPTQRVSSSPKWNTVLDGGFPYGAALEYNDFETFMHISEPPAGKCGFWRGENGPTLMRLGTPPVYQPSVMAGQAKSMTGKTPSFKNIVRDELGLEVAAYGDHADFFGYFTGETTYLQAMSDLAAAQAVFFGFDRLGRFFVRQLRDPSETEPSFVLNRTRIIDRSLRKQLPATAPLPVSAVSFRGYRNYMHGQVLAPAVFEEEYPGFRDSGTSIASGGGDIRVISVLHWLLKEYATDAAAIPPPPAAPPPAPAPAPEPAPAPAAVDMLVEDQFAGAGPVNAHAHDQAMYGHAWSGTSGYTLGGGDLVGAAGDPGAAFAITVPTSPIDFTQEMITVTGEWVAPSDAPAGLLLQVDVLDSMGASLPGRTVKVTGSGSGSGATLNLTGASPAGDLAVSYTPGLSHPFTLRLGDTYSTFSMAGGFFPKPAVASGLSSPPDGATYGGVRLLLGWGSAMRSLYVQRVHLAAPPAPTPGPWPPEPPEEGVLFLDTFQGESTLQAHSPDYAQYEHAWSDQPLLAVAGGKLVPVGAEEGGAFVAAPPMATGVSLVGLELSWTWRAPDPLPSWHPLDPVGTLPMLMLSLDGATVQDSEVDGAGVPVVPSGADLGRYFRLLPRRDDGTGPYLVFGAQVDAVAVVPGQEYAGTITISESNAVLGFLGATLTHELAATPPSFDKIRGAMWWGGELSRLQVSGGTAALVVLHDSFDGAGELSDHVPDSAMYDLDWSGASSLYTIDAGTLVTASGYGTPPVNVYALTSPVPGGVVLDGTEVSFGWVAPSGSMPVTGSPGDRVMMVVGVLDESGQLYTGYSAQIWTRGSMSLSEESMWLGNVGDTRFTRALSPGQEYQGKLTLRNSGIAFELGDGVATYVPASPQLPSELGFGGLVLMLHHASRLTYLTVTMSGAD